MLELKTSDGDDGRSLSTLSPLGWDHGVLGRKEEKIFIQKKCIFYLYLRLYYIIHLNYLNLRQVVRCKVQKKLL